MLDRSRIFCVGLFFAALGCAPMPKPEPYVPATRFSSPTAGVKARGLAWQAAVVEERMSDGRAQLRLVDSPPPEPPVPQIKPEEASPVGQDAKLIPAAAVTQAAAELGDGVKVQRAQDQRSLAYQSMLSEGDPGMTGSLYREDRYNTDLYRDFRPYQPMDLITIVVTERALGRQFAITEVKGKSEVLAGIKNFFGLENRPEEQWTYPPDMSSLISANTKNDFKGQGDTNRLSELTARLSAIVVEVLPSGLLRIEGEKILAVNNEEQVMVVSGLVRQRDITSNNEVNSSQIAQMRIDYYGKGTVGEAQYGGWFARAMRILWPF